MERKAKPEGKVLKTDPNQWLPSQRSGEAKEYKNCYQPSKPNPVLPTPK